MDGKKKVLVLDDVAEIRAAVSAVLRHYNINVAGARTVEEAETLVDSAGMSQSRFPYDLLIVDLHLEGKSGVDFIRNVREKRKSKVPVLVISGTADSERVQEVGKLGVNGFLVKPFTAESLWERAGPLLKDKRS
jgi:two-component system chemotaxis response regulator CheY